MGSVFVSSFILMTYKEFVLSVTFGRLPLVARFCTFPFVAATFAPCGLFVFPASVWANQVRVGLCGGFFQCDRTRGRRLLSAICRPELKFPSGVECGGDAVAFGRMKIHRFGKGRDGGVNVNAFNAVIRYADQTAVIARRHYLRSKSRWSRCSHRGLFSL